MKSNNLNLKPNALAISNKSDLDKLKRKEKKSREPGDLKVKTMPILKQSELNAEAIEYVVDNLMTLLKNSENTKASIEAIFFEMIESAYTDRIIAYNLSAISRAIDLDSIQNLRQKSDNHLLQILKAYIDFKKPSIKVSVRKLEQMNIAEKQVNIKEANTRNLDKNEKIS